MNKIPYRTDMILNFFGKGKRFSHKTRNSLPKRVVKSFNMAGLPCLFADSTMPFRWKDRIIRFPEISVTDRTLTIYRRQGIPETLCARFVPASDMNTDNFTRVPVFFQPYQDLIAFIINKGPQFVTFGSEPSFRLFFYIRFLRNIFIFLIDIIMKPTLGNPDSSCYTGKRDAFPQKSVNDILCLLRNNFFGRILNKPPSAFFAQKSLFSVVNISVFYNIVRFTFGTVRQLLLLLFFLCIYIQHIIITCSGLPIFDLLR
ncbi:Uncharacterized protein dnm_027020 [Desulfonema magnum]|uniref:Uncharacterized protein n=1 Tax=Desulfonema magnum TaxID=45655 RepID=A0A975BJU7_9BACT|nr:Uncharacterized protein dnm_027020 [Desulfonema magnum]